MLTPVHVSIISSVSFDGIEAMVCVVSAGPMLPAPRLLTACSLEDSQEVSLFTQSMAMTNVDECPLQRHDRCCVVWMWRRCHRFPFCLGKDSQSLSALGPHVTCFVALEALSLIVALCFRGRFVLCILALAFPLDVLAFSISIVHTVPLPLIFGFVPSCIGVG